ncbi:hypothetical protein ABZN20_03445 [Methylococcus sp. ANG]|uniref:hypothetical protein n=1 Tax=Methylococcus sp. ANG TaxID=3231903 RepID=UPI00345A80BA
MAYLKVDRVWRSDIGDAGDLLGRTAAMASPFSQPVHGDGALIARPHVLQDGVASENGK